MSESGVGAIVTNTRQKARVVKNGAVPAATARDSVTIAASSASRRRSPHASVAPTSRNAAATATSVAKAAAENTRRRTNAARRKTPIDGALRLIVAAGPSPSSIAGLSADSSVEFRVKSSWLLVRPYRSDAAQPAGPPAKHRHWACLRHLVHVVQPHALARRDVRLDWLRGLAMACVIVNHSKLSSLLSWFSYERMGVVTAAEVFVVLSGVVIGMVYGRRLARDGWRAVVGGLGRRAALLYAAFVGVTLSVLVLASLGIDVTFVAASNGFAPEWFLERITNAAMWRDVLLMRAGPWPFEIIGLYVWLVAAAVPCLLILRRAGW